MKRSPDCAVSSPIREHPSAMAVLRRFIPELRPHRARIAGAYLCGMVAVLATLAAPWPLKFIIDSILGSAPLPSWFTAALPGATATAVIVVLAAALLLIGVTGTVFAGLEQYFNARVVERLTYQIRERLLRHVQTLPLAYRTTDQSGEIALRLVDDVCQFVRLLSKTLPTVVRHLVTAVVAFAALFWLQPAFGMLGLLVFAVIIVLTPRFAKPLQQASKLKRHCEGEVAGLVQEIMRGLPDTMALSAEEKVRARFAEVNARSLDAGVRESRHAVAMERTLEIVKAIGRALILCGGGLLVLRGNMSVGDLTVGIAYLASLMKPMAKVNELASSISRALARGEQLLALLDRKPEIVDAPNALAMNRARGAIAFRDVSFGYKPADGSQTPRPVLTDVNLDIAPGSFVVVIGLSGSGKSTLLGLLLRLFDPTSGQILLDGVPITQIQIRRLRAQFAVMLQETHLFSGTIRESLQPALRDVDDGAIWSALAMVSMDRYIRSMCGGLDASLSENGVNFSGGQRARLSLARALLTDSPIVLLDEPLANVDPESQEVILEALAHLRDGRTWVAVTHQSALAQLANQVLEIDCGRVVSSPMAARDALLKVAK